MPNSQVYPTAHSLHTVRKLKQYTWNDMYCSKQLTYFFTKELFVCFLSLAKFCQETGIVVNAMASHQCGPSSIPVAIARAGMWSPGWIGECSPVSLNTKI